MADTNIVVIPLDDLECLIYKALQRFDREKTKNQPEKLLTINQVAKRLGKSHSTIKRFVGAGLIKSNKAGLISEQSINDFLKST
jgi:hypothetical protein